MYLHMFICFLFVLYIILSYTYGYSYTGICHDVRLHSSILSERFLFRFGQVFEVWNYMYIVPPAHIGVCYVLRFSDPSVALYKM